MFSGKYSYNLLKGGLLFALLVVSACSRRTLNQADINRALYYSNPQKAYDILSKDTHKWEKGRNKLLYYWDRGTVAWMLGKYKESSELFLKSDYFIEDVYRNYANIALSMFTNDKVKEYVGEDHEKILFHYYQILNFMKQGNMEYALVQTRRLQLELFRLDDRYKDRKNKDIRRYQRDAFAYVLIGLVYEAAGETNNAFIAYKNAVMVYEEDYRQFFGTPVPEQLKVDILRTAYQTGLRADLEYYEKKFGFKYDAQQHAAGNFVFFWNSGLSPVKEEVSINFQIIKGINAGWVTFINTDYGFSFPIFVGEDNTKPGSSFTQVEFVRVAFPKYVVRGALFNRAALKFGADRYELSEVENITAIGQKVLGDRFLEEIGKTLLRLAMKKSLEYQVQKNNPEASMLVGIINAVTEQADTRSWETLPHQVSYTRFKLPPGTQQLVLETSNGGMAQSTNVEVNVPASGMIFQGFHTLQPAQAGLTR